MRILVADDHSVCRRGLHHLLAELDENIIVLEANRFEEAERIALSGAGLDLIILDLYMPGTRKIANLEAFRKAIDPVPIVIFSMSESVEDMREALEAGARAFLSKSIDDRVLISVLRLVLAGGVYVPSELRNVLIPARGPAPGEAGPPDGGLAGLSSRQMEILLLLGEGLSNQAIGERLGLSINTVKGYVTQILAALGVENRTQAVLAMQRAGGSKSG